MADAKTTAAWREAKRQILLALNLPAEYEALGLRLAGGGKANAKGWIYAHSFQADDKGPSAGINVADGPLLGYYHDFRDAAKNCGFFDFCIRARGGQYADVLKHFAAKTGVKLPNGDEERTVDRLEFRAPHYSQSHLGFGEKQQYASGKAGVTIAAMEAVGCLGASWPRGLSADKQNQLLVVPMYGSSLLHEHEPTGWHCAAVHPLRKIRKFAGKGNEEQLLKTLTLGEPGLMGLDGLKLLAEATVVNLVEGLTDLLATEAALIKARELDPQYEKHVVLSTGGSTYFIKPEWLQHFAGKDVRVWGDVGDKDGAGDKGAARNCTILLPVAGAVRNVKLPLGPDDGKNDVRAWLTEPGIGRGYAQMDEFARTFSPIEPGDEAAQLSAHDAILQSLGMVVLGEHEQSQRVEVYAEETRKTATLIDLDKLTIPRLIQLLGPNQVAEHIHDGKEPQPGKFQLKDVKNAIASSASERTFKQVDRLGGGVWEVEGELLIIRTQQAGVVRHGKIEPLDNPFFKKKFLDLSQASEEWCDFGTLQRYLNEAQSDVWCQGVFDEATKIFNKWFWKQKAAPQVMTSLIISSWLQTTWSWRPEVFVTGDSDTGKSLLVEFALPGIFGPLAWHSQKVTEAAIRQHLKHHSKIPIQDEFEHSPHRQAVLELWRVAGRGGKVSRGTADHKGIDFYIRHQPWFAAIETGLKKQPDKNRFIILEMLEIPAERRGYIQLPTLEGFRDLGQRLLAVGIRHHATIKKLASQLKLGQYKGVPGRVLECFSLPTAIAAAVKCLPVEQARELIDIWLSQWDFSSQVVKDKMEVLDEILRSHVRMDRGITKPASQLLYDCRDSADPEASAALQGVGLRWLLDNEGKQWLFIHPKACQRYLMRDSEYSGHSLSDYLTRLPGAKRETERIAGRPQKGICVPSELVLGGEGQADFGRQGF